MKVYEAYSFHARPSGADAGFITAPHYWTWGLCHVALSTLDEADSRGALLDLFWMPFRYDTLHGWLIQQQRQQEHLL